MDKFGDLLTGSVYLGEKGELKRVDEIKWPHSAGAFYAIPIITLGFKPRKHAGKITGLAAYGTPARDHIEKYGFSNVCLAGGIFANVKVNQRIHELESVESIFVHPHMGDGGTGAGAALQVWAQEMLDQGKKPIPTPIKDVYLGLSYSDEEIEAELKKANLNFEYCADVEGEIAELISKEKVVARFNGRMEYGPRALGNRSILYEATDPSINDWLNERLKRTEFMPFAPVTLIEYNYSSGSFRNCRHSRIV